MNHRLTEVNRENWLSPGCPTFFRDPSIELGCRCEERYIEFDREQTLLSKVKLPQDKKTMSLTRDRQPVMFQENSGHLRLTR